MAEIDELSEKRTKLHIVRDMLELAHYPCTKTYMYRHSDANWSRFSDSFQHLLSKEWLILLVDKGGNGDLFGITSQGKRYFDQLCKFLASVE